MKQGQGLFILGSQVSAIGSQVQAFSTRFGFGIFLHLHQNLNTRTRYLTAETRDLKNAFPANAPVSCFPLSETIPTPFSFHTFALLHKPQAGLHFCTYF
jgi:hypothetical protein